MDLRITGRGEPYRSRRVVVTAVFLFVASVATATAGRQGWLSWLTAYIALLLAGTVLFIAVAVFSAIAMRTRAAQPPGPARFVAVNGRFGVPARVSPALSVLPLLVLNGLWTVQTIGWWGDTGDGDRLVLVVASAIMLIIILPILLVSGLTLITAWQAFPVELTPAGLHFRTPLARRWVPWAALAPGGPLRPQVNSTELPLVVSRPDLVRQRGWAFGIGSRRQPTVPARLDTHPWFLADAIRWYVEHPEERAAIGTAAGRERLLTVLTGTGTGTGTGTETGSGPPPNPDRTPSTSGR